MRNGKSAVREPVSSSVRQNWTGSMLLLAATVAIVTGSYSFSLKVASERRATERLHQQTLSLESDLKALNAELRVRMRMPQLQRWNDNVLGLVPISASQYLDNPVRLANYGKPLENDLPKAQLAVRDVIVQPQAEVRPQLIRAELPSRPAMAAPQAPKRPEIVIEREVPRTVARVEQQDVPTEALLRDMELAFGAPAGGAD